MKLCLVMTLGISLFARCAMAQTAVAPATGDGSKTNPYQIATLENLYWITTDTANFKYSYKQTADINASETSSWFSGQGWTPIGSTFYFSGIYDGGGHVIDSLFVNRPNDEAAGLFAFAYGKIINLGVTHANISGGGQTGAILGSNGTPGYQNGTIENCFSSGVVGTTNSGRPYAGGIVGYCNGIVKNCFSEAIVNGPDAAGGLVGASVQSIILNSYAIGPVDGHNAGGLVGASSSSLIMNCYSAGRVSGTIHVGGLVGGQDSVTDQYNLTDVYNSFWDVDSSGQLSSGGGTGKTTTELKNPMLFVNACWDSSMWVMDAGVNNGHPYLSWQNPGGTPLPEGRVIAPASGDGSGSNPYLIASLENLCWVSSNPMIWIVYHASNFVQVADIHASKTEGFGDGEGWVPLGTRGYPFYGRYSGGGHTIDSLFVNRPTRDYQGLFGYANGTIDSLGITNARITGRNEVGSLSGYTTHGTHIGNCFSTGSVHGTGSYVGGLIGVSGQWDSVTNCYSKSGVNGALNVGGLMGSGGMLSFITNCYAAGAVTGGGPAGGLFGSIASGRMPATVLSSYWDTGISGQDTSAAGTGKTTLQMKLPDTFSRTGWSSAVWAMDSTFNDGYPYLAWQRPGGTALPLLAGLGKSVASIDFGLTLTDRTKRDSVQISNPGTDTLLVTDITSTNQRFTVAPSSMKIGPSGSSYLKVTFAPQDVSMQTGFVILAHNASASPDTLAVRGQGASPNGVDDKPGVPTVFAVSQNYPNPFNPTTLISYSIPHSSHVSLVVYDVLGRVVAQLVNEVKQPGRYTVPFDGSHLASGVYPYSIVAGSFHQVRKMMLLK